jgi:hypothetical protein
MRREPAQNCLATIQFLYLDELPYFMQSMPGRWSGSPQPAPLEGFLYRAVENIEDQDGTPQTVESRIRLWDSARLSIISKMDIPAGEQEYLDIAVRCDDDEEAYGLNNESYVYNWRNPKWRLPKGRYLAEVTVRSAGDKISRQFVINNDLSRDEFRIDPR